MSEITLDRTLQYTAAGYTWTWSNTFQMWREGNPRLGTMQWLNEDTFILLHPVPVDDSPAKPDLIDALEAFVQWHSHMFDKTGLSGYRLEEFHGLAKNAKAALAKAKGEGA